MVDLVGDVGNQVSDRIVRDAGEMTDGVESLEVGDLDIPDILADGGDVGDVGTEGAFIEQIRVEADNVKAGSRCSTPVILNRCIRCGPLQVPAYQSQILHCAFPDCQRCSSSVLSRMVSMHCQKPSCR